MRNTYSLGKNISLLLLALMAFIYALPNWYSEDPVIEIAAKKAPAIQSLQPQVTEWLAQDKIPFKTITTHTNTLEIRFPSTDIQLHAHDILKKQLSHEFTMALNLLPSTPYWLRLLGASPMRQGLDLRGGVHFLLDVDVNSVLTRRYEGLTKLVSQTLRQKNIRYTRVRYLENQGIVIEFRDNVLTHDAQQHLKNQYAELSVVQDSHANTVLVTIPPEELSRIRQNTVDQTMTILRKRVDELGVSEAVVQQQGSTRVAVDLPGIQDATRAKQILGGTATLQFYLVDSEHDAADAQKTGIIPGGSKLYRIHGQPLLLKRQVVLNGDAITSALSSFDQQTARPAVSIQLGGGGEALFTQVTRDNIGKRMAIVYVESTTRDGVTSKDERVISAPVIESALGHQFQITGLGDMAEAKDLALLLRAGALPTVVTPVEERMVGPSLGQENIHRGIVSLAVGMGLILILMAVYYRLFGWIANVALVLNLIFLMAVLSILGATLTLPGIAGIVLTVGMAVDTNVLIYERIREELRAGMSPQAAIYAGYERAFATILDANVTTLIVGVVLFCVGTGPVRGFAVTLSIGLLTSMLTGVTYTRGLVNAIYGSRSVKQLSIGI
jgi:preprotein translocase subunit SecD